MPKTIEKKETGSVVPASAPETKKKIVSTQKITTKSIGNDDNGDPIFEAVVSSDRPDRSNEIIDIPSLNTDKFEHNPVVLYGHTYHGEKSIPIGKSLELSVIKEDGFNKLVSKFVIKASANEFAAEVARALENDLIRMVSIGGMIDFNSIKEVGSGAELRLIYQNVEMVEFSVVPIGDNPDALLRAKELNLSLLKDYPKVKKTVRDSADELAKSISADIAKASAGNYDSVRSLIATLKKSTAALEAVLSTATAEDTGKKTSPKKKRVREVIVLRRAKRIAQIGDKANELVISELSDLIRKD